MTTTGQAQAEMRRRFAVSLELPIAAGMRRAYLAGVGISCVRACMLLMQVILKTGQTRENKWSNTGQTLACMALKPPPPPPTLRHPLP